MDLQAKMQRMESVDTDYKLMHIPTQRQACLKPCPGVAVGEASHLESDWNCEKLYLEANGAWMYFFFSPPPTSFHLSQVAASTQACWSVDQKWWRSLPKEIKRGSLIW